MDLIDDIASGQGWGIVVEQPAKTPSLGVVPSDVQEIGRLAYRMATELRSGSTALGTEVDTLLNTWKGSAADSYRSGWDEMHRGATDVWDALFDLADKLGITADNYRSVDAARAHSISSLNLD
jgi:WXG100 family type VII secretion target